MNELVPVGVFVIIIGIFIVIMGIIPSAGKTDTKFFTGGIIGFIPFGFGNDKRLFYLGLALTIVLFILFLWYSKLGN